MTANQGLCCTAYSPRTVFSVLEMHKPPKQHFNKTTIVSNTPVKFKSVRKQKNICVHFPTLYDSSCESLQAGRNKAKLNSYAGQQAGSAHWPTASPLHTSCSSSRSNSQLSRMTNHICHRPLASLANSKNSSHQIYKWLLLKKNKNRNKKP